MPQSLSLIIVHLVFSTKDRFPFLDDAIRPQLHAYVATSIRTMRCECYRAGGVDDHIHLAIRLARTVSTSELVETIKTASSKWVKEQRPGLGAFGWQRGYGVFSVAPDELPAVVAYIDQQKEHHRTRTFQEEYREWLGRYGVGFDERYVWD